jgi:hypothetical protein
MSGLSGYAISPTSIAVLFDAGTGERISDAEVRATVAPPGFAGETKALEPMTINQAVTYGHFFRKPASVPCRINVKIRLRGASEWIVTDIEYRHF